MRSAATDSDGKVRRVGPPDKHDRKGKLAEDALIEALGERRPPAADAISLDTLVMTLVDRHLARCSHVQRLMRPSGVVVVNPFIKGLLG